MILHMESRHDAERVRLEERYSKVITELDFPERLKVLCFLDCYNDVGLMSFFGATNRGFHLPLKEHYARPSRLRLPDRITNAITFDTFGSPGYDNLVYLHGNTTKHEAALVMSLAHELQHVLQYTNHHELWLRNLIIEGERSNSRAAYSNSPSEREAMLVSRRIGSNICGREVIAEYIENQIKAAQTELIRWNYQNDWNANFLDLQRETDAEVDSHLLAFPNSSIRTI
jgi:hypothetical protein